ncbi:MAG: hypothetical protein CL927_07920 [Deltaproteobacteria bacterium]|nr:hypothetical protein [Deltaproteobacteria bacterium]
MAPAPTRVTPSPTTGASAACSPTSSSPSAGASEPLEPEPTRKRTVPEWASFVLSWESGSNCSRHGPGPARTKPSRSFFPGVVLQRAKPLGTTTIPPSVPNRFDPPSPDPVASIRSGLKVGFGRHRPILSVGVCMFERPSKRSVLPPMLCWAGLLASGCDPSAGAGGKDTSHEPTSYEGDDPGECSDAADNDRNGLYDCDDPGCAGSPDCDGSATEASDADGDGFDGLDQGGTDCDDDDPSVNPDAVDNEGDGIDQDCDGVDGVDGDGDGVASGEDCDDTDASTYPGAPEIWGDGIDQDCDGVADVEGSACSADITINTPEGRTTTLDFCQDWNVQARFEYDPDDHPEVLSFVLTLNATTEADFQCTISVVQEGVCETGYYDARDDTLTAGLVTLDCSGVADEYETSTTLGQGYLLLTEIDTGTETGSFAGSPLPTTLAGRLHVWDSGYDVNGELDLTLRQVAPDGEEQTACATVNPDFDSDGSAGTNFDGPDCADTDPLTYPGAADLEDASACMTDADDDGWGDLSPADGVTAGTDCNDANHTEYPGAVTEATGGACMFDGDGDGYGDATATAPYDAGTDCADADADTHPGAASLDDATACMTDVDGDEWGDWAASGSVTPGTDCNDADTSEYPGAVTEATSGECMRDADADGYGDKTAASPYDAGTDCNDGDGGEFPGAVTEATGGECMRDVDTDGYGDATASSPYDAGTDCNDGDGAEYPGAAAEATGSECLKDSDRDGWGDVTATAPYDVGTDCHDSNAAVYPGAAAAEPSLCTIDNDADGWGDAAAAAPAEAGTDCNDRNASLEQDDADSDGYSTCELDCDDGDSTARPGAASKEASLCTIDADGDGYGDDSLVSPVDKGSDCDDTRDDIHPGIVEGPLSSDVDCDGSVSTEDSLTDASYVLLGENGDDYAGLNVVGAGDVDGDGLADLLTPGSGNDDGGLAAGKIYLLLGGSLSSTATIDLSDADYAFIGEEAGDSLGWWQAVDSAGDIEGDGKGDLLFGASSNDLGGDTAAGAAYVVAADSLGSDTTINISDADYRIYGTGEYTLLGNDVASAGDVDGDGKGDLLLADASGAVLFFGASLGSTSTLGAADADVRLDGATGASTVYQRRVHGPGDFDGDGQDDILVGDVYWKDGDPFFERTGRAYLVSGADLTGSSFDLDDASHTFSCDPATGYDDPVYCGAHMASVGDYDADGKADVLIGASDDMSGDPEGAYYIFLSSSLGGTTDLTGSDADYAFLNTSTDEATSSVASAGDVDGDGVDDLIYGDIFGDRPDYLGFAKVLLSGTLATPADFDLGDYDYAMYGETAWWGTGWSVNGVGDVDGNGLDDVMVGAPYADGYTGRAYLILSRL